MSGATGAVPGSTGWLPLLPSQCSVPLTGVRGSGPEAAAAASKEAEG